MSDTTTATDTAGTAGTAADPDHDAALAALTADWQARARNVSSRVGRTIPAVTVPVSVFDHR